MKTVYIYCEGQAEESFINDVLCPYFMEVQTVVVPIICTTKRALNKKFKGGVQTYGKIQSELIKLCRTHRRHAYVTTMFDYYGMPSDTPSIDCEEQNLVRVHSATPNPLQTQQFQPFCGIMNTC